MLFTNCDIDHKKKLFLYLRVKSEDINKDFFYRKCSFWDFTEIYRYFPSIYFKHNHMTRLIEFDKYVHNSYLLVVKLFHGSQIIPRYHLLLISLYHSELWEMDFTLIPVLYSGSCWPSIVHFTEKWSSPHYQPCAQSSHRSRTNNNLIHLKKHIL